MQKKLNRFFVAQAVLEIYGKNRGDVFFLLFTVKIKKIGRKLCGKINVKSSAINTRFLSCAVNQDLFP